MMMMEFCYSVYRVKLGSRALQVILARRLVCSYFYLFSSFF